MEVGWCVWKNRLWPDCDELWINFQFSWKTFSSMCGPKLQPLHPYFITGLPVYVCLDSACFKGYIHPYEKITWEVKRVGMWMGVFQWVTWGHVRFRQNIVKLLQSGSEFFILCISKPACFLVHRWVRPHGAPAMEAGNGAGKSAKKTNLTWHLHPARGWLTSKLKYVNKV